MTISISLKNIVRIFVFLLAFGLVMSVAFLVDAREVPDANSLTPVVVVESEQVAISQEYQLQDIPDGLASWYGRQFQGRRTASGKTFDMHQFTAAHRTLPFGSLLKVINPVNGKSVFVEVTDRGPFIRKRVVDLSAAAAKELGVNVTPVTLEALTLDDVQEFYTNNDSTVLAINDMQNLVVLRKGQVDMATEHVNLTTAMRTIDSVTIAVVQPQLKSLTFSVGTIED